MAAPRLAHFDRERRVLSSLLLALSFGLAIGLALGALGGGGSVLAVPVLVYVLGQSVPAAITASLLVVTAGSLAGSLGHARHGHVCWRHAAWITMAALPGLVAGTFSGQAVGDSALLAGFALVMLGAAAATWRRSEAAQTRPTAEDGCPPLRVARDLAAGALVGFLTGFFGVGGGFLIVPALALGLAFSMRLAVGTSLAVITTTSLLGAAVHLAAGHGIDLAVTGAMTIACVAGGLAGASVAARIPRRTLAHAFSALLAGVALYLLTSVTVLGGPPAG